MNQPSTVYCTQCGAAVNLPAAFLRLLWEASAGIGLYSRRAAATECATRVWRGSPGATTAVPVLPFNPGTGWKARLEMDHGICRKRPDRDDLPAVW